MKNQLIVAVLSATGLFATQQISDLSESRNVPDAVSYRGFKVDVRAILAIPNRDAILDALRRQIDIVNAAAMSSDQQAFLKSVPISLSPSIGGVPGSPGAYVEVTKSILLQPQVYDKSRPILLHELLHAYHDQKIPGGFRNPEILALFQQARDGRLFPITSDMLSNVQEYFAMMASVYLHGSAARDPFTRQAVMTRQPDCFHWLEREFGAR